jgi:hypothetical protein
MTFSGFPILFHFIRFINLINPNESDDHSAKAPLPTGRDSDKLRPGLWQLTAVAG